MCENESAWTNRLELAEWLAGRTGTSKAVTKDAVDVIGEALANGEEARILRFGMFGTRHGRTVLVQLRDATDPETGQRYTAQRYKREMTNMGDSWRHEKINLEHVNPDFEPIMLTDADEGEL